MTDKTSPDSDQEKTRQELELKIQRQIGFVSGLFQEEVTVRTVLESIAEGVVVVDEFGTILLVNSRAEQMFGYSRQELIGKPHALLIPERFRTVHQEHEAEYFKEPRIRPMGLLRYLAARRKDGSEFPVEISLGFIDTSHGILVMAFISDITLRKEFEDRLRESNELFRIQVECVKDYAVFMLDPDGNVLNWNTGAERLKGFREEEIVGRHFSCFYPEGEQVAGMPEMLLQRAEAEGQVTAEGWRLRKDGSPFWADVIITALRDTNGMLRGFSKVTHDITERKRAEDALRESEQRFASFMLHLPAAAWIKDMNGRYVYVNAEAERVFSTPSTDLLGKTDDEIFPPETARQFRENDLRVLTEEGNIRTTEVLRQANGVDHHSIVSKFSVPGPDGGSAYVAGVAFDITEREQAEKALRLSEARFRALHDDNPIMIFTLDAEGTVVSANPACTIHLGYTADELAGQPVLKIFHEDDRPAVSEQLAQCLQNPERVYRWQFRKVSKDGRLLWVEEIAQAIYDLNGALNVLVVCQDITERKQAEEALQKSEEKFSVIFNTAPVGITISTLADGRFVDINAAGLRFSGYRRDEVIGHTALEFDIWSDPQERARTIEEVLKQGEVRDREMMMKDKKGTAFWASYSAVVVEIRGEKYLLSLVNDITGRKRAEEEIERLNTELAARATEMEAANRELDAFNYTVAHDLRKPLTIINSYTQIIKDLCGSKLDEKCTEYLEETYKGTVRMNLLIDALLNFSHLANAKPQRKKADLSAAAHEIAADLKQAEPARQGTFRIARGVVVDGDPGLLRVVLENLLGNAWKYTGMREEAVIEFGAIDADGKPAFFVRDNGAGFDMANAEKLFIPFQRLPGTEEYRGHGIGLATVERIIRRHGGRIWAEGEPGKGATFYFTVPGDPTAE